MGVTKVLILGSSGYIGSHLQVKLTTEGYTVRGYDKQFGEDVRDRDTLFRVVEGFKPTVIVHLASIVGTEELIEMSKAVIQTNLEGSLNVFEVCYTFDIPLIILTSSQSWLNPWQITMEAVEKFALMYQQCRGLNVVTLRVQGVYGPGQSFEPFWKPIPAFLSRVKLKLPIEVPDSNLHQEWVFIDDLIVTLQSVIDSPEKFFGSVFTIRGQDSSLGDVAKSVTNIILPNNPIIQVPRRYGEEEVLPVEKSFHCETTLEKGLEIACR